MGRLLILLSLMNDEALTRPVVYPSYELKRRRAEYYDRLMGVRETGDFEGWIKFFCDCLLASACDARDSMGKLADLHFKNETLVRENSGRGATNALKFLELLEANPIVDASFVVEKLDISKTSASSLIALFGSLGLLKQREGERKRYRTFSYEPYLAILRSGDEPL